VWQDVWIKGMTCGKARVWRWCGPVTARRRACPAGPGRRTRACSVRRRRPKAEWLAETRQGRFIYHTIEEKSTTLDVAGDAARLVGRTVTDATVYGTRVGLAAATGHRPCPQGRDLGRAAYRGHHLVTEIVRRRK